jgi:hypothetical protein
LTPLLDTSAYTLPGEIDLFLPDRVVCLTVCLGSLLSSFKGLTVTGDERERDHLTVLDPLSLFTLHRTERETTTVGQEGKKNVDE